MKKLQKKIFTFFVLDCKRGERWLLFLGAVLALATRQSSDQSIISDTASVQVEEVSLTTASISKTDSILLIAESLVGVPYRYTGKSPSGFDCSGFIHYVYQQVDIPLNASSRRQFQQGSEVSPDKVQPGDLVFFRGSDKISHVGMITEKDDEKTYFIHASTSRGVVVDQLEDNYFLSRLAGIRRILPS